MSVLQCLQEMSGGCGFYWYFLDTNSWSRVSGGGKCKKRYPRHFCFQPWGVEIGFAPAGDSHVGLPYQEEAVVLAVTLLCSGAAGACGSSRQQGSWAGTAHGFGMVEVGAISVTRLLEKCNVS